MEYISSLKNLYGLNENQLENLKQTIKLNIFPNNIEQVKLQLDVLMKQQTSVKNQIPKNKFNQVSNFIIEVYSYINEFKSNSVNTEIDKVYDLSSYHLDSTILHKKPDALPDILKPQKTSINNNRQQELLQRLKKRKESPQQQHPSQQHPLQQQKPSNLRKNVLLQQQKKNSKLGDIDPYELYGISRNTKIDINELKSKYKQYALQTHPDKNNGDTHNFNIVNEAFKVIYEDYKLKQNDKQFNELKNNSKSFIESQSKTNYQNKEFVSDDFSKGNFNSTKFNKIFNDTRIGNANDDVYGDWSKSNEFDSEDIVRDTSLNKGNFNNMFDTNVKMTNKVVKYTSPQELFMNDDNNCEELGVEKVDSYTGRSKTINYTDYKEAHTTTRLVDPNTEYNTYNSLDEVKAARSNMKDLTTEEIMEIELEKSQREESEDNRLRHLLKQDNAHFENYNKIHNIMLSRR